ncbi:glycosyltransferase family 39 protein [Streptomyces justiciae]|uniref:glycosyltransferase family 39 protein n=1 Tax=Streptomyces justiciae TaxID=2780140 RepID=UPI001881684D|nr:glycosyltransferase family 39 protein [Streptomyces justiciae]MBE8475507.1 glycosyltransferase family 39 protein [Streptomyces justiciae]MCW8382141.1 glycosyltransferase family 39 protein [Streptomyces justiciae]
MRAVALGSRRVLLERLRVSPALFRARATTVLGYLETWTAPALRHPVLDQDRLERRYRQLLAAGLVLLTSLVSLWKLDRDATSWRDETVSYAVAKRTPGELWLLVQNIDAVHGLYYFLAHLALEVRDDGILTLRILSVLGTMTAALGVYAIGNRLGDPATGFLAGVAFLCIPQVQFYAQEARSYALVSAAVIWATWFFVRALHDGRRCWWAGYAGLLMLGGWLHVFALLVILAHAVTLWRGGYLRRLGRSWMVMIAIVGCAVAPLAVVSAGQASAQLDWLGRPSLQDWLGFVVPAAVAAALGVALRGHDAGAARTVTFSTLGVPLLIVPAGFLLTVSLAKPWYVDRYVLYCMSGLALLLGQALRQWQRILRAEAASGRERRKLYATAAVAFALFSALGPWYWQMRSAASRTDTVESYWGLTVTVPGDPEPVLFQPARRRAWVLARPAVFGPLDDIALQQTPAASGTLYGVEASPDVIRQRMLQHREINVLRDRPGQPLDDTPAEITKRAVLRQHYQLCWVIPVNGGESAIFIRRDAALTNPLCAPGRDIYS